MRGERQGARAADRRERSILSCAADFHECPGFLAGLRGGGIDLGVLDPVVSAAADPCTRPQNEDPRAIDRDKAMG
jgi:hypothetical protein